MKNFLVTGGCGFIGSLLVKHLLNEGNKVTIITRRNHDLIKIFGSNHKENLKLIVKDIADEKFLKVCKELSNIDWVIHLAATGFLGEIMQDPLKASRINILGTHNILEVTRKIGAKRFLYASTCYVYGTNANVPFKEDDNVSPNSLLGITKHSAEQLCKLYSECYDINTIIPRIFTAYGPKSNKQQFIMSFIRDILNRNKVTLRDPIPTRDFIFVTDVLEAFSILLKSKFFKWSVYNIGSGKETKIGDVVDILLEIHKQKTGKIVRVTYSGKKRIDEKSRSRMVADIKKMRKLGWTPKVSLKNGLKKTYGGFYYGNRTSY